jgi:DNA modification methylase/ParB-like chromosome segregation protein Spo0J
MEADLENGPTQSNEASLEPASQPLMVATSRLQPHPLSLAIYGDELTDPELVASVAQCGVLEPLSVLKDGTILSGHRRWRAAQAAGLASVPVTVVQFASTLDEQAALIEHNRQRVKSYSQRMREADQLEEIERERAEQRQRHHGGTAPGRSADTAGNLAGSEAGETRDKVAAAVGMKARSFAKLRSVYKAAQQGSELAAQRLSALDAGDTTINAAYQDVRREEAGRCTSGLVDPDAAPQAPEQATSRLGDLWVLGEHRLACGDATDAALVARLMAGERAALMATDPPYLVDYDGGNHPQSWRTDGAHSDPETQTKHWDAYVDQRSAVEFYGAYLRSALAEALSERPTIYQFFAMMRFETVLDAWRANGLLPHQVVIWHKSRIVLGRSWYMYDYEPCLVGWIAGRQPEPERRPPANAAAVWQVASTEGNEATISSHPTVKAVELIRRPIAYHTRAGELLYEPFSGSGTAIVACEMTSRRCYAIELAPLFVDQAVLRWQRFSGKQATLQESGLSFAEVAAQRDTGNRPASAASTSA